MRLIGIATVLAIVWSGIASKPHDNVSSCQIGRILNLSHWKDNTQIHLSLPVSSRRLGLSSESVTLNFVGSEAKLIKLSD
jgi:hypothetical protein